MYSNVYRAIDKDVAAALRVVASYHISPCEGVRDPQKKEDDCLLSV